MKDNEMTFLHLTHSDPRSDARVLKQMSAGVHFGQTSVFAIGREDPSLGPGVSTPSPLRVVLLDPPGGHRSQADQPSESGFDQELRAPVSSSVLGSVRRAVERIRGAIRNHVGLVWLPIKLNRAVMRAHSEQLQHMPLNLIQVHDFWMLRAGTALRKKTGAQLIYDAHELESSTNGLSRLGGIIVAIWETILWKHIDGFMTVSEGIREIYFSKHRETPSRVILNAPEVSGSSESTGDARVSIREHLGLGPEARIYVYLGYLSTGRGIELILEAFSKLPRNLHCAFVGTGDLAAHINAFVAQNDNIHLVDPVPHAEVVDFISSADFGLCLIQPVARSYTYALPNKLFECIVAGLPVLGSNLPEISRIIRDYDAGMVTDLTVKEIAEAATSMSTSPRRISSSGVKELTWERQVEKLHSLYTDLLKP